jgi:cysteine desulfurase / selenocysteine lyase
LAAVPSDNPARYESLRTRKQTPPLGQRVECRLARFDPVTGELDLDHLASRIDARTKLVCCTGASNFTGARTPLGTVRRLASASGYRQADGEDGSYLLVDAAQLAPGSYLDVQALDADFLAFSFHKMLAPFGVGVLYAGSDPARPPVGPAVSL